ncbi:class I SAM-dependent methyltransferase [Lachnospiraceae bacterium 62-26]
MEKNGRIFIFGGGVKGKELLDYLIEIGREGDVEAFIDNDIKKQKDGIKGLECISVNEAIQRGARDAIVLVSLVCSDEIEESLKANKFTRVFCTARWMWENKYYKPDILEQSDYKNAVPFNHYESPYPDIVEIHRKEDKLFNCDKEVLDINFNINRQLELVDKMKQIDLPGWKEEKTPMMNYRYYYGNEWFEKGSADALYYMIRILKPHKIIEVGSGYSTAVMLDVNENYFNNEIQITSIEPDPARLKSLLKQTDNIDIIEKKLQDISENFFEKLEENDILFIDSSHISKIDSDVNHLFFDILPLLSKGVYVHLHDVMYPFTYPKEWIYEGRAYNEMYMLRAFLMNNEAYSVQFFGDMLSKKYARSLGKVIGCGEGSFWMRKEIEGMHMCKN